MQRTQHAAAQHCAGAWVKGQEGQEGSEQAGSGPSSPPNASGRNSPTNGARPTSAPSRQRHSHQPSFTVSLDQPIILMDNYVDMGDGGQEGEEEAPSPVASRLGSQVGQAPDLSQSAPMSR